MSNTVPIARRKRRRKTIPVLGAAGLSLSLATGASAAVNPEAVSMPAGQAGDHAAISETIVDVTDVSLATFHLFDRESGAASRTRTRFAASCGGCGGCAGCGGCWTGTYYTSSIFGPEPYPPLARPARKHRPVRQRALGSSQPKD